MKHIKTFENLHKLTAKDKIEDIVKTVYVELEKTYLPDGDKEYSYHISEKSKELVVNKIIIFLNQIFDNQININYDEIISFLDNLEISQDNEEELDEDSVKYVTQDIYDYIDDCSDYELDAKFELSQNINKYNL